MLLSGRLVYIYTYVRVYVWRQAFFTQDALENITSQTIENLTQFVLGQELKNAVPASK